MRNVLVFQHVAHEILGTLNPLLKKQGLRIRYVNFERDPHAEPDLEGYNGLIVLGGPMGVYESDKHPHLLREMKVIEQAMKKNIPVLGICLGAQMIASVLKADVKPHHKKEIGWSEINVTSHGREDRLLSHFQKSEKVFQLHGDSFDVPKSAVHLASSPVCEGQAFRYQQKVYGLQFHLEVDETMILRWLTLRAVKDEIKKYFGDMPSDQIITDTGAHIMRSLDLSIQTFQKFVDLFGLPERPVRIGSGHR